MKAMKAMKLSDELIAKLADVPLHVLHDLHGD
jgi:hypothetical protein